VADTLATAVEHDQIGEIAYIISGGRFTAVRTAGVEAVRTSITAILHAFIDRVTEIRHWDEIRLLRCARRSAASGVPACCTWATPPTRCPPPGAAGHTDRSPS
jgi:hypothetical protein